VHHRDHNDWVVDAQCKHPYLIYHLTAATAKCHRHTVACMNLTEGIRVHLGSFDYQSKDDKCHREQEDILATSWESILLQDAHGNPQALHSGFPT
jgi:hypothetical protein